MSLARNPPIGADLRRISREAGRVRVGKLALTAIASILYALGWLAGAVIKALTLAARWLIAALMIGWHDSRVIVRRSGD